MIADYPLAGNRCCTAKADNATEIEFARFVAGALGVLIRTGSPLLQNTLEKTRLRWQAEEL